MSTMTRLYDTFVIIQARLIGLCNTRLSNRVSRSRRNVYLFYFLIFEIKFLYIITILELYIIPVLYSGFSSISFFFSESTPQRYKFTGNPPREIHLLFNQVFLSNKIKHFITVHKMLTFSLFYCFQAGCNPRLPPSQEKMLFNMRQEMCLY